MAADAGDGIDHYPSAQKPSAASLARRRRRRWLVTAGTTQSGEAVHSGRLFIWEYNMTEEMRLDCLRLAVDRAKTMPGVDVLQTAKQYADFVLDIQRITATGGAGSGGGYGGGGTR